ncbi:hypothetical protein D3C77_808880 [compost metagenome]
MVGDQFGSAGFLFAQFRVLVNVPAPLNQLRLNRGGILTHLLLQCGVGIRAEAEQQTGRQQGRMKGVGL